MRFGRVEHEPWRSLAYVAIVAVLVRAVMLALTTRPMFMSDSGTYLDVAFVYRLPADRPIGLSMFYRAVFEVAHDLRAVVVVQTVLGAASAMLAVVVALQCGLRAKFARAVGIAAAISPTMLVYERVLIAELLVIFLCLLSTVLLLSAIDSNRYGRAVAAGFIAGGIVTVRTNNTLFLIALAGLAVAATGATSRRSRAGILAVLVAASAVPMAGYSMLYYTYTTATYGVGEFALSAFDGISLFGRYAQFTDCSDPERPPAIRAELCDAGDDYLTGSGMTKIIWDPGPVFDSIGGPLGSQRNHGLRTIAKENIRAHPYEVVTDSARVLWADLTRTDRRYAARASDMSSDWVDVIVTRHFGAGEGDRGSPVFADRLQDVYAAWVRVRPVIWVATLIAAGTTFMRPWRRNRVGALAVGGFFVPLAAIAVSGVATARYVVPLEWVALLSTAWVGQLGLDRYRRRTADALKINGGTDSDDTSPINSDCSAADPSEDDDFITVR